MTASPSPARKAAVDLLDHVLIHGRKLSEANTIMAPLEVADRAAAQRLCLTVLRHLDGADWLLKPHLQRRPGGRVQNILRLGAVELALGGAAHGVVHDCVELAARGKRTATMKGMVNAVLRRVGQDAVEKWPKAKTTRLPGWLRAPLAQAWGKPAIARMEQAHAKTPPLDLSFKDPDQAKSAAETHGWLMLPTGSVRVAEQGQVSALPGFQDGTWWVQDAAAALPVRLLGDVSGLSVLDMCAAPGGKTLQLAAAGAEVTALDLSEARLERVRQNLTRTGLTASVVQGNALEHDGRYDAILLDAPCSATGTIRRHPDLPHARLAERISDLIALQTQMLDHAIGLLKPGGKLVFATCSLLPDEGECQVEEALTRHSGLRVLPAEAPGVDPAWRSEEGGLRLTPDIWSQNGGLDGFYMALLTRDIP